MEYDIDRETLSDVATKSARAFGPHPALGMVGSKSLDYSTVERFTRRTATALARAGVLPGDRVAILSENGPEWCIASLAIARAGAVSVPILVDFPPEQVLNIIEHSGTKLLFASDRQSRRLVSSGIEVATLPIEDLTAPRLDDQLEEAALAFKGPRVSPRDLAAIIYTSGTTGVSKGVMLTHRNIVSDATGCLSVIRPRPGDVLLSILPLAHAYEYTIGFIFLFMNGTSIRYLGKPPSASVLLAALAEERPTLMLAVPLVMEKIYRSAVLPKLEKSRLYRWPLTRLLLERVAGMKLQRSFGGRVRFFGLGGAPVPPDVEQFLHRSRFPYSIGYGLTETAPLILASAVGKTAPLVTGIPTPETEIRLVGPEGVISEPSLVGEVQVRGPMVSPGYYRDDARTREAFTDDGFFRTGDLGSYDAQGRISVRGRLKNMILGPDGKNIYPEEIESVVNRSPYVAESLVYCDERGLAALVHLKPEVVEEHASKVQDWMDGAEKAVALLLERVKDETNGRLASFSRLRRVEHHSEPFEKTPTQKIKRFLYPKGRAVAGERADEADSAGGGEALSA